MAGVIEPGSTLGVLGGGQLGKMFGEAARRLGYRVAVFSPDADPPAASVADLHMQGNWEDTAAVSAFAEQIDAVTLETENIPFQAYEAAASVVPARPSPAVLRVAQDRSHEKEFLRSRGFPLATYLDIVSERDLANAMRDAAFPSVLKTTTSGYDGKGQVVVDAAGSLSGSWEMLAHRPCVLESWVAFEDELSVIVARRAEAVVCYGPFLNVHRNHVLDTTRCPAGFPAETESEARRIATAIAEELDLEGLLCVEMFRTSSGELLVNELAPRPHNSGHLTIEAHLTDQFTQQVRLLAGHPPGPAEQRSPAAMANLLGDLWAGGEPDWSVLKGAGVTLHLYGKREARAGRKMGHLTALASTADEALRRVDDARGRLQTW